MDTEEQIKTGAARLGLRQRVHARDYADRRLDTDGFYRATGIRR